MRTDDPHCLLVLDVAAPDVGRTAVELAERGTLGWEEAPHGEWIRLSAYFPLRDLGPLAAHAWERHGARLVSAEPFERRDWMRTFRRAAQPFPLGDRLYVDPGEPVDEVPVAAGGRRLLQLPARQAFGTGTHESTRLAVELLERIDLAGTRLLDVGTGTGILAFAATVFGAEFACGFDVDPAAALAARDNRRLNRLAAPFYAGGVDALSVGPHFDVVVANVRPERIRPEYRSLAARLKPSGRLVLSGFLAEEEPLAERIAAECERVFVDAATQGEWAAWSLA